MGNRLSQQSIQTLPVSKFPIAFAQNLLHKPLMITNILVILDAKGEHFVQKYFSSSTPLLAPIKPYIDLCNIQFTEGQLKDKPILKQDYQVPISEFQTNGILTLRITQKKLILDQTLSSCCYIKQNVIEQNQGIILEQKCYLQSENSLKEFYFEEDVKSLKYNLNTLLQKHTMSQIRKVIHQSYKRSKSKQTSFENQSEIKLQKDMNSTNPSKLIGKLFNKTGVKVSYSQESTALSTLSLLSVFQVVDSQYYEAEIDISNWNLKVSDIKDDQFKRITFIYEIKDRFSEQLKVDPEQIYVSQINFNKAVIAYPHSSKSKLIMNQKKIFDHLEFSQSDFDSKGNRNYEEEKQLINVRGGYPYYRPIGWKRFGLNIQELTVKDVNQNWISNTNAEGQWAIMYHGVRNPAKHTSEGISIANAIVKFGFKIGCNHVHQKVAPLITKNIVRVLKNKGISIDEYLSEQIYTVKSIQDTEYDTRSYDNSLGQGIYGSPLLSEICVDQGYSGVFQVQDQQYLLAFQCRVKPESIYISSQQKRYWLVRNPKNIRPYGILIANRKSLNQSLTIQAKSLISKQYTKFCEQQEIF